MFPPAVTLPVKTNGTSELKPSRGVSRSVSVNRRGWSPPVSMTTASLKRSGTVPSQLDASFHSTSPLVGPTQSLDAVFRAKRRPVSRCVSGVSEVLDVPAGSEDSDGGIGRSRRASTASEGESSWPTSRLWGCSGRRIGAPAASPSAESKSLGSRGSTWKSWGRSVGLTRWLMEIPPVFRDQNGAEAEVGYSGALIPFYRQADYLHP